MNIISTLYPAIFNSWFSYPVKGNIWFYSDPHFGDQQMQEIRHISDEEQIKRINCKVGKCDVLVILGDVGDPTLMLKLHARKKILIMGNHDAGKTNYQPYFDEIYEGALMINSKIILSHEPIQHLPTWLFNIHGHDHSNWFTGSRHLNVCAEHINYTPVSFTSIIKDGLLHDIENIHRITIDNAIARKENKQ